MNLATAATFRRLSRMHEDERMKAPPHQVDFDRESEDNKILIFYKHVFTAYIHVVVEVFQEEMEKVLAGEEPMFTDGESEEDEEDDIGESDDDDDDEDDIDDDDDADDEDSGIEAECWAVL